MKIALLFGLFPDENRDHILSNSKGVIHFAADALQRSLVDGFLSLTKEIDIINLPYIGSFPLRYSKLNSPSYNFFISNSNSKIKGQNAYFCNLSVYKFWSRYVNAKKTLLKWAKNSNENKVVIIYSAHSPFLKAAVDVKKKVSNLKICLIVPDLPQFMSDNKNPLYFILKKIDSIFMSNCLKSIDSYVLLSKFMIEKLPIGNKPWIVVEGIFNSISDDQNTLRENTEIKNILYTGTLARRYGVLNLIKAFSLLPNKNYRLIICGNGDAKDEIINLASKDDRIIYKGQLNREDVLKLQRQSDLLVNPRTPEGEYTKYSFPSKTMEYLASGVPTLIYKLPGIPDEYFNHCFTVDGLSIRDLAMKIDEILDFDVNYLRNFGEKARHFILTEKNPIKQCEKILNLIKF